MAKTSAPKKLKQYDRGEFRFTDKANGDYYDRHLVFDHVVSMENASQRETKSFKCGKSPSNAVAFARLVGAG